MENTLEIQRRNISFDFRTVISIEEYIDPEYSDNEMTLIESTVTQIILEHPFEEIHRDWMQFKKTYPIFN